MYKAKYVSIVLVMFFVISAWQSERHVTADEIASPLKLSGQMLIASPTLVDPRFQNAVVYVVDHDETGAFGLIVNKPLGTGPLDKFLSGFGISTEADLKNNDLKLLFGGPVEPDSLFLLHSADYQGEGTQVIDDTYAVTARLAALEDLAQGRGPERFVLAVGYAGWGPKQLEKELNRGDWIVSPAKFDVIFGAGAMTDKWHQAIAYSGLSL